MNSIKQLVDQLIREGAIEDALVWLVGDGDEVFCEPYEADELGAQVLNIAFREAGGVAYASITAEVR